MKRMSAYLKVAVIAFLYGAPVVHATTALDVETALGGGTYLDIAPSVSNGGIAATWVNYVNGGADEWNYPDTSNSGITVNGNCLDDKDTFGLATPAVQLSLTGLATNQAYELWVVVVESDVVVSHDFSWGTATNAMTTISAGASYGGTQIAFDGGHAFLVGVDVGSVTSDPGGNLALFLDNGVDYSSSGGDNNRTQLDGVLLIPSNALGILNGSFEAGSDGDSSLDPIAGWTDAGNSAGFWLQTDGSVDGSAMDPTAAYDGTLYLTGNRAAGGATSQPLSSTLSQTIALSDANLARVQSGAEINLSFAYSDQDDNDSAVVDLVFLDASANEIGSISSGTLPNTGTSTTSFQGWDVVSLSGLLDAGTEAVRIDITSTRIAGTAHNLHFDRFEGALDAAPLAVTTPSPGFGAQLSTNDLPLSLGVVLLDGSSTVDPSSIELLLDGTTVTLDAGDIVQSGATTTVSHAVSSLAYGKHEVSVQFSGTSPAAGPFSYTWSFSMGSVQEESNPPICPRWAFEPWVWEDEQNTQNSTLSLVADYKQRNIPVGAVIVDSPWSTSYNSFEWDTAKYPDAAQMISDLHGDDVRVVLWITGAQNSTSSDTPVNLSPYFTYATNHNYAVNGGATYSWWKGTGIHIDFTNPDACDWFGSLMTNVMALGIDGWKADQAESSAYMSYPVSTSIGSLSKEAFKPYYYGAVRDQAFNYNSASALLARPYSHQDGFAASIDKCTIGWCGDFAGDFNGLNAQIYDLYISALAGYGALYVEIGGYQGAVPTKESLIRYAQFGALMPVMSNGGSNGGLTEHLPWHWDVQTEEIYRYYATLHSELAPYLFSASVDSHLNGGSMVKDADYAQKQHRLGEQIFASFITGSGWTSRDVALPPEGAWIDYWDENQLYASGSTLSSVPAPLDRVPMYIKAGAIIPMNVSSNLTEHGDATYAGRDTVVIYPFGISSCTYHRALGNGIEYDDVEIAMDEETGTLSVTGSTNVTYRFRIKSFSAPTSVTGADSWSYDAANGYVVVDKEGSTFTLNIEGLEGYSSKATNFELWQEIYGIAGAPLEGDSDTNGVVDVMEYYLGSNPVNPLSPDHVLSWSSDYLSVTHSFNSLASGVTGSVEWTMDLVGGIWSSAGVSYTTNTAPDQILATLGTSTTNQLFVRLKVAY